MAKSTPSKKGNNEFYEVMSATANPYALGNAKAADPASEEATEEGAGTSEQQHQDDAKLTAIITLILTAIVAIALGVLFLRGIDAVKSSTPPQTDSSGSLEL